MNFDSEPLVASAAEAVKGLRFAPMNSANYKTVRSALDCLPRYGFKSQQELLTQLRKRSAFKQNNTKTGVDREYSALPRRKCSKFPLGRFSPK